MINFGLFAEQEGDKKEKKLKYSSETSFSMVLVKGNNDNISYSFDTKQNLALRKNKLEFKGRFINAKSNGKKTSEIYYSHMKYDRQIKSFAYMLGFVRYERNKLAGYNYRLALSGGGGATWLKSKKVVISSEVALGWNNEENSNQVTMKNINSSSSVWEKTIKASFISSIITNKLDLTLSKTARCSFQETIFINLEESNDYRLNSFASIYAAITPSLALKTSVEVIYSHQPVPGFKNTDSFFLTSLVIKL
jgi:putative salt-induced outer membrane protein YdiY